MKLNTNPQLALADISSKVSATRSNLPSGIDDPSISVSSGSNDALMYIRFVSDELNTAQITDYINRVVKPQFFTVNGVSSVDIFGATTFGLRIWLDPDKMAGNNLSGAQVLAALTANNLNTAAGNANGYYTVYKNKVDAKHQLPVIRFSNPNEISLNGIFASKENVLNFINNPKKQKLEKDPLYQFSSILVAEAQMNANKHNQDEEKFSENTRLFLDGLRKSHPNKKFYPDANSTMRLTYGSVDKLPFRKDRKYHGVKDNYYTDLTGMVAKYKKGDEEFDLPQRLLDLYKKKDYGQYKDKKGYLPVNFLSNNDITGGNSGSPIINAEGHLIGLAFDGNSEALSGDIVFEPALQRTINVDARFVLWVIDKYAGAKHLIDEMTIVK